MVGLERGYAELRHIEDRWLAVVQWELRVVAALSYRPRACLSVRLEFDGCRPADHRLFRRQLKAWGRAQLPRPAWWGAPDDPAG